MNILQEGKCIKCPPRRNENTAISICNSKMDRGCCAEALPNLEIHFTGRSESTLAQTLKSVADADVEAYLTSSPHANAIVLLLTTFHIINDRVSRVKVIVGGTANPKTHQAHSTPFSHQ